MNLLHPSRRVLEFPVERPKVTPPAYLLPLQHERSFASDLSQRGGNEERAFVRAITGDVLDRTGPLVFADWLDEHGRTDEADILRDPRASPVICPFRVLPYWRHASVFMKLLARTPDNFDDAVLTRRLWIHHYHHGSGFFAPRNAGFTRLLMLDDRDAVRAGIGRWPLMPGEPEPVMRLETA